MQATGIFLKNNHYCPLKKTREHTYNKNYIKLSQKFTKITLFTTKIVINCSKLTKIILLSVNCKMKSVRIIFPSNKQVFNKLKRNL